MRPFILLACIHLLGGQAFGGRSLIHARTDPSVLRSQTPRIETPAILTGIFEVRPTLATRKGSLGTENFYEISWWLKPDKRLSFGENFFTAPAPNKSQSVSMGDGFLRYQARDVKKNEVTGMTVSVDVRANLPLSQASRDAGMITALRSTVLIAMPITTSVRFEFRNTPILYFFKAAGHESSAGPVAHPVVENRTSLGPVINLSQSVVLMAPLNFSLMKYRKYRPGASHEGELQPDLSFSPEVDWTINPNLYLGLAFRTESLMMRDQIGMILSNTAGSGYLQFVMGLSF
ncbi:hypothetical protein EBR78_02300 [bacterium]|nr:hypothetical protein [bacterium]